MSVILSAERLIGEGVDSGEWEYFDSILLGSDTPTISFGAVTPLDINAHGRYRIIGQVAWDQATVGGSVADMYFNDLTTLTDYVVNEHISSATATPATFERPAFMRVSTQGTAEDVGAVFVCDIYRNVATGIATWESSNGAQEGTTDDTWCKHTYDGRKKATLANITKITLDAGANPVSNNWKSGSLFTLQRQKLVA